MTNCSNTHNLIHTEHLKSIKSVNRCHHLGCDIVLGVCKWQIHVWFLQNGFAVVRPPGHHAAHSSPLWVHQHTHAHAHTYACMYTHINHKPGGFCKVFERIFWKSATLLSTHERVKECFTVLMQVCVTVCIMHRYASLHSMHVKQKGLRTMFVSVIDKH